MSKAEPSAARLSLMTSQLQLDFVAALEALRQADEHPERFRKSPVHQLETRLYRTIEQIEREFHKVYDKIDACFTTKSDEEFINDGSISEDSTPSTEPEYISTDGEEASEPAEFCSDDDDDLIEILN